MRQSNTVFYLSKGDVDSICSTDVIIVIWAYLVFLRGIKTLSHHVMLNTTCTYMLVCYVFHQSRTRNKEPINYLPVSFLILRTTYILWMENIKIHPVDISSWISRKSLNWLLLKNYWIFSGKIWYVFVGDIMNLIYKTSINLRGTINITNVFWVFLGNEDHNKAQLYLAQMRKKQPWFQKLQMIRRKV